MLIAGRKCIHISLTHAHTHNNNNKKVNNITLITAPLYVRSQLRAYIGLQSRSYEVSILLLFCFFFLFWTKGGSYKVFVHIIQNFHSPLIILIQKEINHPPLASSMSLLQSIHRLPSPHNWKISWKQ
jgi:hypothetical protein